MMPKVNVDGVNINYEIAGQGKPVVLVHGYTGSLHDWRNQIAALSPAYKVIALDMRGHGKSSAPNREEEYSVKIFSDDVFNLLSVLDIGICCLAGHSLGGAVAIQFALDYQYMLSGLVLVDAASEFLLPPDIVEIRNKLCEIAVTEGMEAAFKYEVANEPRRKEFIKEHPDEIDKLHRKLFMTSVYGYIHGWKALTRMKPLTPRLSEIMVPILIYLGEEDVVMADMVKVLKEGFANSELVTVKGAGHSPQSEAPDVFNETFLKFLDRITWNKVIPRTK